MKNMAAILSCSFYLLLVFLNGSCERMGFAAASQNPEILPFVQCSEAKAGQDSCSSQIKALDKSSDLFLRPERKSRKIVT